MAFVHLHNHTQYSMLDGACRVDKMIAEAKEFGMPAVAMTDHGNMFGTIDFVFAAKKAGVKPIVGLEAYVINSELDDPAGKKDKRYHLVLLAETIEGYHNLMKLTSYSFTDGFYYKPRISKSLLRKYSKGIIALSACVQGEVPRNLLNGNKDRALEALNEFKEIFENKFYIEIQDHGFDDEKRVLPELLQLAKETNTPLVATNDCHYLKREDAAAHDVLLCIQTGKSINDPDRMRYGTEELYFKSEEEMRKLFPNLNEAFENTVKIAESINFDLDYDDFLLPKIEIPEQYKDQTEYLRALCDEGAKELYPEITAEIQKRIDYELGVIGKMGYEGYFLVVKDFIDAARRQNVPVGPGRGSAAGSIVSYLLQITLIDPMKYGLLFERFLTEDRIGMPDIDIDFCAEGRQKVLDYVVQKYGRECVTQIVTFGTLGAKSVVKDIARVMDVPAAEANKITKLMPTSPKLTIKKALQESPEFNDYMNANGLYKSILKYGQVLEGLIRQIGVHACGVVIAPDNLSQYIPLAQSNQKGSAPIVISQFEGKWLDDLKLLKMDFLGLKTLTLIKKTVELIQESQGKTIDMSTVNLKDKKTYDLLSRGKTDGVFQFESAGMKKYMMELQPTVFEDLIAMVALYRPGPMQFIDSFIKRKHGEEKIIYDHQLTESSLKETYGVTVYQEQVMHISRVMGGFSGSEADTLRKAMGKKKLDLMAKLKIKFVEGANKNGVSSKIIERIWNGWLEFAKYAFNKSHATWYAYVAYQTAYLKAHFPVEFMAALLTLEDKPEKIPYFVEECKNMKIEVIPPSVNNSKKAFSVIGNKIMFGLRGIKNVGDAAIQKLIEERDSKGKFKDLFDFSKRVDTMVVNKSTFESLTAAGAMDELPGTRAQKYSSIEIALDLASSAQQDEARGQLSLFDMFSDEEVSESIAPKLKEVEDWSFSKKLEEEKNVLGYYISGHPLTPHKPLIDLFTNIDTRSLADETFEVPSKISIIGLIVNVVKKISAKGNPFAFVVFEDMFGRFEMSLFGKDYDEHLPKMELGKEFLVWGERSNYNTEDGVLRILPKKIVPLEQMNSSLKGEFYCQINEQDANSVFAKEFNDVASNYPGKFSVHFKIKTKKFKTLLLHPRSIKVYPSKELLDFVETNWKSSPTARLNFE